MPPRARDMRRLGSRRPRGTTMNQRPPARPALGARRQESKGLDVQQLVDPQDPVFKNRGKKSFQMDKSWGEFAPTGFRCQNLSRWSSGKGSDLREAIGRRGAAGRPPRAGTHRGTMRNHDCKHIQLVGLKANDSNNWTRIAHDQTRGVGCLQAARRVKALINCGHC